MLLTRIFICLLAFFPALLAQEGTGSVEGQVVNTVTGAPVRNASVALTMSYSVSQTSQNRTYEAQTNEQGRFAFRGMGAGRYRLTARRTGYLDTPYESRPGSADLWIGDGQQLTGLAIRIRPQGVIAGKVVDAYDEPVQGASVVAMQWSYPNGRPQLTTSASATTNDLGEYRVAGVSPGEYFVLATPQRGNQRSGWDQPMPQQMESVPTPTYYPAATDQAAAKAVAVGVGAEVRGINVKLGNALGARIRGAVTENNALSDRMIPVVLRRAGAASGAADRQMYASTYSNGQFQIFGVPPGSYLLTAQRNDGQRVVAAARTIEVRDRNIDGIRLEVTPAPDIQGTVVGDPVCRYVTVSLWGAIMSGMQPQASVGADMKFTLGSVVPGAYTLNINTGACYLRSVRFNGREVIDMALSVDGPGVLEIALAYSNAVVEGAVTDSAGKPAPGGIVTFMPKSGSTSNFRMAQVRAGSFSLSGLAPGAYDVFAWEGVNNPAVQSREYLKQYESSAKSLVVEPGGRTALQLIAISTNASGAGQARPAAKGSVEGQVLNAVTGAPLPGAKVMFSRQQFTRRAGYQGGTGPLVTSSGQPPEGSVEADAQGRFSFREIEPGMIYLAAELRGFGVPSQPDQPNAAGEGLIVGEGQRVSGAVIRMPPEVVLSGKVTDEYGEPVDRAQVTLYRAVYVRGLRQLMRFGVVQTDDLGQYRIPDVAPGSYYLSVTRRFFVRSVDGQPARAPGEPGMGYGTTWFPNAPGLAGASALLVDGAQPPYLTMVLRRAKVFRLRGTLLDAGGQPAARAVMSLMPRGLESNASAGDMTVADGAFEVSNVPAGSYVLLARSASLPGPMALLPVEVRDANVDGLKLQLSAGREIRGTVKSDAALASFLVGLYPQGLGSVWGRTNGGAFSIRGVLPAVYSVDASGLCSNCYVKSVRYGGKEVSEDAVDFSEDGQLEIEVSTRGASLHGTAVDRQGKPVPRAAIVVAPAAGTGAIRTGVTDQAGRFDFASLRPGAYRIFAWTGVMPDPSPEALARFQGQAKPVNLLESGRERVEVIAQ